MKKRVLLHIAFWIAYLINDTALEFAWVHASMKEATDTEVLWLALRSDLSLLPVKLLYTYFILYVIIDHGLFRNRKTGLLIAGMIPATFVAIVLHRAVVFYYLLPVLYHMPNEQQYLLEPKRMLSAFLDVGFCAACAVALKLLRTYWQGRDREKNLVKEKLEAELKFLRNQTNPHFLFNTLNNIYALARKKSDNTADVVMKLSKLLRFMLYESRKEHIPISDELRLLDDYIELEKIRYNERLTVNYFKKIDDPLQQIAPLLLLPFVENAFKHGAGEARFNSFIHIDIKLDRGILDFSVENSKENNGQQGVTENIGLSNVRRQLELMYKEHNLQVDNGEDRFHVSLTVNLNSNATI